MEEKNTVYIDGRPGVVEIHDLPDFVPTAEPAEAAPEVVRPVTGEEATLTATITPEAAAALMKTLQTALDDLWPKIKAALERVAEILRKLVQNAARAFKRYTDAMLWVYNDNPKWWHYYKTAKKRRVRKKYRRLLVEQMCRKMAEQGASV